MGAERPRRRRGPSHLSRASRKPRSRDARSRQPSQGGTASTILSSVILIVACPSFCRPSIAGHGESTTSPRATRATAQCSRSAPASPRRARHICLSFSRCALFSISPSISSTVRFIVRSRPKLEAEDLLRFSHRDDQDPPDEGRSLRIAARAPRAAHARSLLVQQREVRLLLR